jgi:hypothetical protein
MRGSFVQQLEPAKDAMRMEGLLSFSAWGLSRSALKEVDGLVLERFRIIF